MLKTMGGAASEVSSAPAAVELTSTGATAGSATRKMQTYATLSPILENGGAGRITAGAPLTPRGMRLGHVIAAGDMLMLRYERPR